MKTSAEPAGPGPNWFSDAPANVSVDARGRLRLAITRANGNWHCAEVVNAQSLGHGRYEFELGAGVDDLDPNVVLGLFTWSDDPSYCHREMDIEFARWGNAADTTNAQYVVQPYDRAGNLQRVSRPAVAPCVHSFDWQPTAVAFAAAGATPSSWTYAGPDLPPPGSEHVRINFWLYRGAPPTHGQGVEVVVNRFSFTPLR